MRLSMRVILRILTTIALSSFDVVSAAIACVFTRSALRGRNYSDVGVAIYAGNGMATLGGIVIFTLVLCGGLYLIQRYLSREWPQLPYLSAGLTFLGFSLYAGIDNLIIGLFFW